MSYVICESCRGYYELEEGESINDFDICQCGGKLSYMDSIKSIQDTEVDSFTKDTDEEAENKKDGEITFYCSNCGNYDSDGIFCSKCGGKLVTLKNGKIISTINSKKNSKQIEELSKRSKNVNSDYVISKEPEDLFKRINGLGVILGIGFFIISVLVSALIMALLIFGGDFDFYNPFSVISLLILVILTLVILMTISGAIAAYMSKSREYLDGALNGLTVGIILGVVSGILSLDALNLIGNTLLYSFFGALGGLIGIWVRKIQLK